MSRHLRPAGALVLTLSLSLAACAPTETSRGTLLPPADTVEQRWTTLWLAPVEITDERLENRELEASALTASIERFIRTAGYARTVKRLPGAVPADDLALHFRFSRLEEDRSRRTLYLFLRAGPAFTESARVTADLVVRDAGGETVFSAAESREDEQGVYLDGGYGPAVAVEPGPVIGPMLRTEVVQALLNQAARVSGAPAR